MRIASPCAPPRSAFFAASALCQAVKVKLRRPIVAKHVPRYSSLPNCSMTIFAEASFNAHWYSGSMSIHVTAQGPGDPLALGVDSYADPELGNGLDILRGYVGLKP